MRPRVLIRDEKYQGQYVALKSFDDNTVVGSGKTLASALKNAEAHGEPHPVILFVPKKGVVQIY